MLKQQFEQKDNQNFFIFWFNLYRFGGENRQEINLIKKKLKNYE